MDTIFNREECAQHIGMSSRTVSRLLAAKLIPHIRVFFNKDNRNGLVFFSKKKLDIWKSKDDGFEAMSDMEKRAWQIRHKTDGRLQLSRELDELKLSLEIQKLSLSLKACLDEDESPSLNEKERKELEQHGDDFSGYFSKISELRSLEKGRLVEFFDNDLECLFCYFPDVFQVEIKAKEPTREEKELQKKIEAGEVVVSMRGGIKVEHYPTLPGTLKEKKPESIQVTQETSELWKKTDSYLKK